MTRVACILLGVPVVMVFASTFVSLVMLRLATEMCAPCRCGEAHDPLDECPQGPPSLRPHELRTMQ